MSPAAAREPDMVGPYRLLQRLGEGGMGVVHLALDDDGRAVAVKLLRPHIANDPEARRRLEREVQTLRRVKHPQVAGVIDADVECDRPYLVTTFVPGKPLDVHVKEHGPLPRGHIARIGRVLADALRAIHAAGIVHRDVKPANVMLLDGDPVLIDFGIAHLADESRITRTGLVMGTPGYLSPEVIGGEPVTAATDWWGWGATLAYAATGRPPFGSGPIELVLDRVRRGASDLGGIDAGLATTLSAALATDSHRRPDPAVLVAGLAAVPGHAPVLQVPGSAEVTMRVLPPTPTLATPMPPAGSSASWGQPRDAPVTWAPPVRYPPTLNQPPLNPHPLNPQQTNPQQQPADGSPEPWSERLPPARPDSGVLLGVGAALILMAAVAPYGATWIAGLLMVVARVVDRSRTGLLRRRDLHGPRGGDPVVVTLGLPWHLLTAAVATFFAMILPILVGISTAFIVASAQAGGAADARPGSPLSLAGGMVALLLTAWWGPGGGSLRHGAKVTAKLATSPPQGRLVVWIVIGLAVVAALLVVYSGAKPDWGPLTGSRLVDVLTR